MDDIDKEIRKKFERRGWAEYYPKEKSESFRIEDDIFTIRVPQPFFMDTNCYLILGDNPTLVDPGHGYDASHISLVNGLNKEGVSLNDIHKVAITHPHVDHASGLVRLNTGAGLECMAFEDTVPRYNEYGIFLKEARERYARKAEFICDSGSFTEDIAMGYPEVYYQFPGNLGLNRGLRHEEIIKMGSSAWMVLHTPGHSPHHIVFYNEERGILISGDMFIGRATSLGDIGRYLNSLELLKRINVSIILPAHGRPFRDPAMTIEEAQSIIEERINRVMELIKKRENVEIWELVRHVIGDTRRIYRASTSFSMIIGILNFLMDQGEDIPPSLSERLK